MRALLLACLLLGLTSCGNKIRNPECEIVYVGMTFGSGMTVVPVCLKDHEHTIEVKKP